MAVSVTTQTAPYVDSLIVDTNSNGTPENDVLSGSADIYVIDIDNSNNTVASYLKIWNHGSPTNSSDEVDILICAAAQTRQTVTVTGVDTNAATADGVNVGSGLSFATTTGAALSNVTNPANPVIVRIMAE